MISLNKGPQLKKTANEYYKNEIIDDIKNSIDGSDMILISKLSNLRNALSTDKLNLRSVKQQIADISAFDKTQNYDFLSNLLRPERARGSKIPSQVPVPSCSFQLHNCVTLSTNASGNAALIFNPFFLAADTAIGAKMDVGGTDYFCHKFLTSLFVNNNASLTGTQNDSNWVPVDIGQVLPPVYDQYRLVSACLVIKYIGRLDIAAGVIGGAIIYDQNDTIGGMVQADNGTDPYNPSGAGTNSISPTLAKYGNFDLAMDSFYHQENMCIEGIKELYFPIDNSFEEYVKIMDDSVVGAIPDPNGTAGVVYSIQEDYYKSGFNWFFYALGCPPNSNCFKIDIYCNFECLPNAKYLNYMPVSLNPYIISPEDKKKMILLAQGRPVLKSNEDAAEGVAVPSLFNKMIKKFDNGLPGFDKLKAYGIMGAVPGLKSGLALANNMIATNMMDEE